MSAREDSLPMFIVKLAIFNKMASFTTLRITHLRILSAFGLWLEGHRCRSFNYFLVWKPVQGLGPGVPLANDANDSG